MVEEVIQLLEEELKPFVPAKIALVIQKYGLEVEDFEGLSKEVLAEGVRRTMPAVEKFFEVLKIPAPLAEIEEALWKGGGVWVSFPNPRVGRKDFTVNIVDPTHEPPSSPLSPAKQLTFPPSWWHEPLYGPMSFHAFPGEVSLRNHFQGMYWGRERAILQVRQEEGVKNVRMAARTLEPFLSHMGLDGIVEALDALSMLEEGKAQVKGPYVLARTGGDWRYEGDWLMRRGSILGDPELDKAALLGREVTLSFPGDVEISFRAAWGLYNVSLTDVRFRLGHKVLNLDGDFLEGFTALSLYSNPIGRAIQHGLKTQFDRLGDRIWVKEYRNLEEVFLDEVFRGEVSPASSGETSSGMLTFLRALAEHESPLKALAEGRLTSHGKASLSPEL